MTDTMGTINIINQNLGNDQMIIYRINCILSIDNSEIVSILLFKQK